MEVTRIDLSRELQHAREPGAVGLAVRLSNLSREALGTKITPESEWLIHELTRLANDAILQLNEVEARTCLAITAAARAKWCARCGYR